MEYLKKATKTSATGERDVRETVQAILDAIETGGEAVARDYASKFDQWDGDIVVSDEQRAAAAGQIPQKLKDDIRFAHDNVSRFAQAQRASLTDIELEVIPGLIAGQRQVPVSSVGCYAPGGRYSHVASAIMTVTTARVAGVQHISACSPPRPGVGMNPAVLYAFDVCGADTILNIGGVQGIAAMAFGLFGCPQARVLAGPGNQFVAEAKRILFGRVGIDMFAGPTESLVIADETADPHIVAADLVGQAEHGYNSPVWLVTTDRALAESVSRQIIELIADLPQVNRDSADAAWRDFGEIILCDSREEAVRVSDEIAPEHLQVQAQDLDWWLDNLRNYGSLFLGEETTVAYGDKVSGPNHVLPTMRTARFSSPLGVYDFQKRSSLIEISRAGALKLGPIAGTLADAEGFAAHAASARLRLESPGTAPANGGLQAATAAAVVERAISPVVRNMHAYPVADATGFTKLDAMENPYQLPVALREALGRRLAALDLNRYPVPSYTELKRRIASAYEIPAQTPVVVGNGSDELISMLTLAVRGNGPILAPAPSFVMYQIGANLTGSRYVGVDLDERFQLRLPAMLEAIAEHQPALIYLAYPNNPTGASFDDQAIAEIIAAAPGLVVIDEAYQPFAGRTWMKRLPEHPNLVVMRTVSKIGLAGIRIGYLAAAAEITTELEKVRPPYNISVLDETAAIFALENKSVLDEQAATLVKAREALMSGLVTLDGVTAYPSATNFILCRFPDGDKMHAGLLERSIMVKNAANMHPLLKDCLRLTVSTPAENQLLLDSIRQILA